MSSYYAGQNIPGYLPMDDEPYVFTDFDSAKRDTIDRMLSHADACDACEQHAYAEELDAAAQDVNLWSGPDYICVSDPESSTDLGIAYWIVETEDESEDQ